jgi:serine/threonine protein kinase
MDHTRPHGIIAKITDFGMSTTIDPTKSHVSNYNKGTVGYSAPGKQGVEEHLEVISTVL